MKKTLFLILCSPVKVVLVMGGGLHMGDLLQQQKQQISKMGYSESSYILMMTSDEKKLFPFTLLYTCKEKCEGFKLLRCCSTQNEQQRELLTKL